MTDNNPISDIVSGVENVVGSVVHSAETVVSDAGNVVGSALQGDVPGAVSGVEQTAGAVVTGAVDTAGSAVSAVAGAASGVSDAVEGAVTGLPWIGSAPPVDDTPAPDPVSTPVVAPAVNISISDGFSKQVADEMSAALHAARPVFERDLVEYAKTLLVDKLQGKPVAMYPSISEVDSAGREVVLADAKNRAWRSVFQGFSVDILGAVGVAIGQAYDSGFLAHAGWPIIGALVVKSAISGVVAFVSRLKFTPSPKV